MTTKLPTLGILGAGKLGVVLAQLATKAGYTVLVAGSGNPQKIKLSFSVLAPKAQVDWPEAVAQRADIVILALPLGKYQSIPKDALKEKIVIDAMNYWWEVDGERPDLTDPTISTSEIIQGFLPDSTVVKALSHIGYHDLHDDTRPRGADDRKAVAIAANEPSAAQVAADIVDELGFDPVLIGKLSEGKKLEPGHPVFGAHVAASELKSLLN